MPALGLDVLFVMSFTLGISWLVWALDARMARGRQVVQLPLPLHNLGSTYDQAPQRRQQPTMAVMGGVLQGSCRVSRVFMLLFSVPAAPSLG